MSATEIYVWLAVILVSVFAIPLGIKGLMRAWDAWRHPPFRDNTCVACGSADLDPQGPGVYRCRACGYEGGENRGAFEEAKRRKGWAERPWSERLAAAREYVVDARRELDRHRDALHYYRFLPYDYSTYASAVEQAPMTLQQPDWVVVRDNLRIALTQAFVPLQKAAEAVPQIELPVLDDAAWKADPKELFKALDALVDRVRAQLDALGAGSGQTQG